MAHNTEPPASFALLKNLPFTAAVAAALHLAFLSAANKAAHSTPKAGTPPAIAADLEHVLRRKSLRRRIILTIEGVLLLASAAMALRNLKAGSSLDEPGFWLVLLVLYLRFLLGLGLSPNSTHLQLAARQNSALLYTLRWLLAVQAVWKGQTQSAQQHSNREFTVTTTILLLVPLLWPSSLVDDDTAYPDATGESYSSPLGLLSFAWVNKLLLMGWRYKALTFDQIPSLAPADAAAPNAEAFKQSGQTRPSLLWRLLRHFRGVLFLQAIWASIHGVLSFGPTILLQSILEHVEDPTSASAKQASLLVTLLFLCSLLSSVAESQSIWLGQKIGFRLRSVIISEIYAKALRRPTIASAPRKQDDHDAPPPLVDDGAILNLMMLDAFKIANAGATMHQVWGSVPVQVIVAITLLYRTLGFSIIAGVGLMAAMVPLNSRIAQRFGAIQMQVMAASDDRIQSTTEMFRSIRIIKFFAWEPFFERKIHDKRAKELRTLRARYILWSIAASIWYGMPLLITFASFFVYAVMLGKSLTPSLAFGSLSLFNLLKMPLDDFVGMITRVQETLASLRRVESYLQEQETNKYYQLSQNKLGDSPYIGFTQATFKWSDDSAKDTDNGNGSVKVSGSGRPTYGFTLENVDIRFAIGRLNVITGPTGSGKSSMLLALLGEMELVQGSIRMPAAVDRDSLPADPTTGLINSVAYCAQVAWLTNDTIRNNILFGSSYVDKRYKAVLEACALDRDLKALGKGDLTRVGERGVSISGGQKQRIALARAVYSNAGHLLLDDCLSAVDSHTATWIFTKCLKGPLVKGRTVVLATYSIALTEADAALVVVLGEGKVVSLSGSETKRSTKVSQSKDFAGEDTEPHKVSADAISPFELSMRPVQREKGSLETIQQEIADDSDEDASKSEETDDDSISWRSVSLYLRAMGGWIFWSLLVLSFVGQQFGAIATNWWVRVLCNAYVTAGQETTTSSSEGNKGVSVTYYFGTYAIIIVVFLIIGLARLLLISHGSLQASAIIHTSLTKAVMNSRFAFFDKTSFGEIINHFSRDLQTVDQDLAVMAVATLHFLVALLGIIILIVIITPSFLVPGIFICIAYYIVGAIYLGGTRNINQMESAQRAPLFQHVSETLSGTTTIRAYGAIGQYRVGNSIRIDRANRPSFFLAAAERWLAVRLGLVGASVALLAGSFAVSSVGILNSGAIGLSLSYAIVLSEHVLWLIRYHTANVRSAVALRRVQEYLDLPQEAPALIHDNHLPDSWPSKGVVRYQDVFARYAPDLDPALRNVNFTANPSERIGIVGRTGAGKSSLTLTLLRGLEVESGHIRIDGMDTREIGLRDLRSRLAIVPQDSTLFAGTLRFNLDPLEKHSDEKMLAALKSVGLQDPAEDSDKTTNSTPRDDKFSDLSFTLAESGSNISQGQRQLVCIARALLKDTRILILDEATASVDHETDLKIQRCVRELDATVITVAHRLRTVIDYDRIVVLDNGVVQESGHPWVLLQKKDSIFHDMCKAASDDENLFGLAEAAWNSDRSIKFRKDEDA